MKTHKGQMRRGLTKADKKNLRNQCRMGLSLSLLIFVLTSFIGVMIYELFFDLNPNGLNIKVMSLFLIGALIFSILLNFLINHKYYRDFQFNEKIQITKTLIRKSKSTDYIASLRGASSRGNAMSKAYIERFEFIVDGIAFDVDKELFESCAEGDKLIFNYALRSQYLLSIEKDR